MKSARKKQLILFVVVSLIGAAFGIVHGIFFDLDFAQIKRLTLFGTLFTAILVFPSLLFIEWLFDLNNREEISKLHSRIEYLEKKL